MAKTADEHFRLLVGEILAQLAVARAENEALREENAALRATTKHAEKIE